MKVTSQNQNNYTSLSKRPKSGERDKYQTIMNPKIQAKNKYASYFQSPNKGEDLLFIKKKFQKMKKNSKEKSKNKTTTNNNSNTNTNISSSYISFMSPINKNYCNKKQNFALTNFLKNKLILNSIDSASFVNSKEKVMPYNNNIINNSGNLSNILKCNITKNNKLVNNKENNVSNNINSLNSLKVNNNDNNNITCNKNTVSNKNIAISKMVSVDFSNNKICTPESSNNNHNRTESNYSLNLNKQAIKDMNKNKKNRSSITSINSKNKENTHRDRIKEKISIKDKDNTNCKTNRKSCRFNFFNKNNENLNQNKLYSYKGMINAKKNNKNIYSNSNQNLLSNTVFEYNKSQHDNNINFFENYVKAVAMNKNNNKYTYNNSISINKSTNFNNISSKKNNHNITYTSNNVSNVNTNRETNTNSINENKNLFPGSAIHSPKSSNISKTTKSSPKTSLINLNKKFKGHIKNKSISIITKNETSLLFKGNNLNNNETGPISNHNNHKYKINYNNNVNYSTTHSKTNSNNINGNNLYSNYGNQYKYSLSKKLNLVDIGNNNKKGVSSPYNVYYKKKTQPNSNENTIIHSNKIKMNLSKNNNNINTTGNNSKKKNIYINKNHFPNHKNLSSLNNSTQCYYNNMGHNKDSEVSSPTNNNNHQYQKTENIIVNNYNININNQIQNNSFFSNNIIAVDSKKGNKNKNNNQICITNQNNNSIPPKQNFKKKKIFSQSLKDILISNNKNAKNFTTNNSPINKLEILLNSNNNNNNSKNNAELYSDNKIDSNNNSNNKFTYKKWSSNRDKIKKDIQKKKVFESISSRKKEENKINNKVKMDNNKIINSQRKYIDLKKRITEEMENDTKTKKNSVKNGNNKDKEKDAYNKINENNINNNRNTELSFTKYNPTLSSRSSTSYDANYYMKESLKLSCYISKYFNKYKKYPDTSLQFYKYGRLIGQGAFGKVNLGLNILTGRIVAVKSFNKNNSELTGDNMKKIKYETDLMKKLNHPNITKILEMFEDEKFFLIIMEYINGGNLFSFVKKRRKLSEKTAKFLFRQIILGIKYIHEQNIVHRDIKLENLLIDLNNNVKICDFGIGRKLENKKQLLHDQCGTLMYMAPEILLSSKEKGYEGFPVDIWSAGISLYIMLSGTLPFNYKNKKKHKNNEEENDEDYNEEEEEESISSSKSKSKKNDDDNFELQYNIVYKEPKHIEKISDEARDLLKGLLNKDPKKRFTCDQILNHPWLYNFKEKNNSSNKFHLFTKAEMIMLSKTFIDYRRANYDDLKENFTLSNLENENDKNNLNEQNITSKSSILAPYNSIISDYDNSSASSIIKHNVDSFDDFNNSKIQMEKDQIVFSKKIKEYNRLYELNNNGEVDNGVLINSKTQSSVNISERSNNSRIKDSDMNLNLNKGSFVIFDENEDEIFRIKEMRKKNEDIIVKNDNEKNLDEQIEHKIKSNNILSQMSLMGYDKKYVLDCVEKNELCHASTVYYLMMNYENI